MNTQQLADKKIGILGFGIENQALLNWLTNHNCENITICDKNPNIKSQISNKIQISNLKFQFGENYLDNLEQFDIVFRTPGISSLLPELIEAKKKGVEISSQIKLFFDLCPAKIIGVTGTKGKGTTVTLISEILKLNFQLPIYNFQTNLKSQIQNSKVHLAGNIGKAPIEFVDKLTANDWVVLELSSFQLQDLTKSPHIAVVLDIKEDHLDYHQNRAEYIEAKTNIVRHQTADDYAIINQDYLTSYKFAALTKSNNIYYFSRNNYVDIGAFVRWKTSKKQLGEIIFRDENGEEEIASTKDITLRGEHNLENICAAICAGKIAGADLGSIKKAVLEFKGLEHRLEYVGQKKGVKYYNDSFSTTPDTAIAAVKSFSEPIILIVGGSEKGADYTQLAREIVASTVKIVIPIGVTGPKIAAKVKRQGTKINKIPKIIIGLKNMEQIAAAVKEEAESGDAVVLSPASASFDMFRDYKDRGNQFKEQVNRI